MAAVEAMGEEDGPVAAVEDMVDGPAAVAEDTADGLVEEVEEAGNPLEASAVVVTEVAMGVDLAVAMEVVDMAAVVTEEVR